MGMCMYWFWYRDVCVRKQKESRKVATLILSMVISKVHPQWRSYTTLRFSVGDLSDSLAPGRSTHGICVTLPNEDGRDMHSRSRPRFPGASAMRFRAAVHRGVVTIDDIEQHSRHVYGAMRGLLSLKLGTRRAIGGTTGRIAFGVDN